MKLSLVVIASLLAVTSASTITATTASTMHIIMDDMAKIGKEFAKIDASVTGFPKTGVKGAAEIHEHEAKMHDLFENVNSNLNVLPKPVSAVNVKKIVDAYQGFTPTIIHFLTGIAAKQPDFVAFSAASTMKNDLMLSTDSCKVFGITIQSMTPPEMSAAVSTMFNSIDTARDNALAAFA